MNLNDYFYLPRTGRFSSCYNPNDRLPIVFGGQAPYYIAGRSLVNDGLFILPCINKSTTIDTSFDMGVDFCYSIGHTKYSTGPLNNLWIYKNGSWVPSTGVGAAVSLHSCNYESGDLHITYISFSSGHPNLSIGDFVAARGMGISTGTAASIVNFNPMEDIKNFLVNIAGYDALQIDQVSYNKCLNIVENTTNYKRFWGVINEDDTYWSILKKMLASINGDCYINNYGRLAFKINTTYVDPNSISAIIPKHEIEFVSAKQRESNLINRCPVSYLYSHVNNDFLAHTDKEYSVLSQNIFGTQIPASPLQSYFSWTSETATHLSNVFIDTYKMPRWEITFNDLTLKRAHLDVGDVVVASFDELYQKDGNRFTNRGLEIIGIQPDYINGNIRFRAWDLGVNMDSSNMLSTSTSYDMTEY